MNIQRFRATTLGKRLVDDFEYQAMQLYNFEDQPTIRQVNYEVDNQLWTIDFGQYDDDKENSHIESIVEAIDKGHMTRKAYRMLTTVEENLPREWRILQKKTQINEEMAKKVPISVIDIQQTFTINEDITEDDIHINEEEVITNITKSVGKAGCRSIKNILKFLIPKLVKEKILDQTKNTINIRISGDGRNVGQKIKHVMVTFTILGDKLTIHQPSKHYTVALFPGTEKYDTLKIVLQPLCRDLEELAYQGLIDNDEFHWNCELYFSSDWKFLAICLGFNAANSNYFCPWCECHKDQQLNGESLFTISKDITVLKTDCNAYPGHSKLPLFTMILLYN
jgi:hypothetical protein